MPVSSLVLTLLAPPDGRDALLARLDDDPRLSIGAPIGDRLPLAADTRTAGEGEALVESLLGIPGIGHVDVVMIDYSDDPAEPDPDEPSNPFEAGRRRPGLEVRS